MSKQIGENAAQKLVRLLAKFNREMVAEGSGDSIEVRFTGEGDGSLMYFSDHDGTSLYGFTCLEDMTKYLEMTPLNRLLASVSWARNR